MSVDQLVISLTIDQQDELKQLLNLLRDFKREARDAAEVGRGLGAANLVPITDMLEEIQQRIRLITPLFLPETEYGQRMFAETVIARIENLLPRGLKSIADTLITRKGGRLQAKYGALDIPETKELFLADLKQVYKLIKEMAEAGEIDLKLLYSFDKFLRAYQSDKQKGITEWSEVMSRIKEQRDAIVSWMKAHNLDVIDETTYSKLPKMFFDSLEENTRKLEERLEKLGYDKEKVKELMEISKKLREKTFSELSRQRAFLEEKDITYGLEDLVRKSFIKSETEFEAFLIADILSVLDDWKKKLEDEGPEAKIPEIKLYRDFRKIFTDILGVKNIGEFFEVGNRQRMDLFMKTEDLEKLVNEIGRDIPGDVKKEFFESLRKQGITVVGAPVEEAFKKGLTEEFSHQKDHIHRMIMFVSGGISKDIEGKLLTVPLDFEKLLPSKTPEEIKEIHEKMKIEGIRGAALVEIMSIIEKSSKENKEGLVLVLEALLKIEGILSEEEKRKFEIIISGFKEEGGL